MYTCGCYLCAGLCLAQQHLLHFDTCMCMHTHACTSLLLLGPSTLRQGQPEGKMQSRQDVLTSPCHCFSAKNIPAPGAVNLQPVASGHCSLPHTHATLVNYLSAFSAGFELMPMTASKSLNKQKNIIKITIKIGRTRRQ